MFDPGGCGAHPKPKRAPRVGDEVTRNVFVVAHAAPGIAHVIDDQAVGILLEEGHLRLKLLQRQARAERRETRDADEANCVSAGLICAAQENIG